MKARFAWVPPLAAAAVLVFGIRSFLSGYPGGELRPEAGGSSLFRDTLIPTVPLSSADSGFTGFDEDSATVPDPFRMRKPRAAAWIPAPVKPSPARKWTLKGTAGNAVATVLDSAGTKHLLRAGDSLSGMRVLEVHANRVLMRDAGGSFEIELEQ